jgi:mRNA interferase RelE/StbE
LVMAINRPYEIVLAGAARRQLEKLPGAVLAQIDAAILRLADDPRPRGCRKLAARDDRWRIRVGDYRIIYVVDDEDRVVIIAEVGGRDDVYRKGR